VQAKDVASLHPFWIESPGHRPGFLFIGGFELVNRKARWCLKRRRPRRLGCRDLPRVSVMMVWIANCQQRRREAFQTATMCSLNCSRDGANSLLFFDPLTNIPLDEARAWPATSPSCLNCYSALVALRRPSREQRVRSVGILPTSIMPMTPRDTATALMRMGRAGVWTYGDLVAMAICVQQSMTCVHEKREGEGGGDLPTHRRVQNVGTMAA